MPFIAISILIQILCAVHCVRNSRNSLWLMVIIFLSIPGCLAYAFFEILPPFAGRREVRALEADGDGAGALALYAELGGRMPGGEARCRQAAMLVAQGRRAEACSVLAEVERRAKRIDRFERAEHADMYGWAARMPAELRSGQVGG